MGKATEAIKSGGTQIVKVSTGAIRVGTWVASAGLALGTTTSTMLRK